MALLRVFGLVLLLAGPATYYGTWQGNRQNLDVLQMMEQRPRRDKTDSANYASALYHGTHARASEAGKWSPTGYATLGVALTIVGVVLLGFGMRRRVAVASPA